MSPSNTHSVLVTAVGGNVGQGVVKALRAATRRFRIIGVDMEPLSAGFSFVDSHESLPAFYAPDYSQRLAAIARREQIQCVYVCSDAEIAWFSQHAEPLKQQLQCPVFVNPPHVVAVGNDKLRTAQMLAAAGLPHPATARASDHPAVLRIIDEHGFPLVLKPRRGASARNVFVVDSLIQLAAARALVPDLVAQQCLPGEDQEYTAGTVSDAHGRVRAAIILRRDLLQGTTYRTELLEDTEVTAQVVRVVERLGAIGPCNVQFRLLDGVVYPFEINPRLSGTTGIRYLYGFNDAELVFAVLREQQEITQPELRRGVVLRYWDEVHLPDASFEELRTPRVAADHEPAALACAGEISL